MKKLLALAVVASIAALGLGIVPVSASEVENVGVCHRTAAETMPYVYILVPPDEADGHITGTSMQHNQTVTWNDAGTWRGVPHAAGDLRLDYLAPGGATDCEDSTPGSASADLSTPTCANQFIVATGTNPSSTETTFSVFINGTLIDNFVVPHNAMGTSAALPVKDGDVVKVTVLGSETALVTTTVDLNCAPPVGGGTPPPACKGSVTLGPWYGDPRINLDLKGAGTFIVKGGIQRTTGITTLNKVLKCGESFKFGRYKVERGHFLNVLLDGVRVIHVKPPRLH